MRAVLKKKINCGCSMNDKTFQNIGDNNNNSNSDKHQVMDIMLETIKING